MPTPWPRRLHHDLDHDLDAHTMTVAASYYVLFFSMTVWQTHYRPITYRSSTDGPMPPHWFVPVVGPTKHKDHNIYCHSCSFQGNYVFWWQRREAARCAEFLAHPSVNRRQVNKTGVWGKSKNQYWTLADKFKYWLNCYTLQSRVQSLQVHIGHT